MVLCPCVIETPLNAVAVGAGVTATLALAVSEQEPMETITEYVAATVAVIEDVVAPLLQE